MILSENTELPSSALPFHSLKEHLRLGTGFIESDLQDGLLETLMRAAIAAVEARTGIVTINRDYTLSLTAWRDDCRVILPKRPVQTVTAISLVDAVGQSAQVDDKKYKFYADSQKPRIEFLTPMPALQTGGEVQITFTAGYGTAWDVIPKDLAQAMILLSAHFYENRNGNLVSQSAFPPVVETLIAPYRAIRGMRH